jgi:hypothetical protein
MKIEDCKEGMKVTVGCVSCKNKDCNEMGKNLSFSAVVDKVCPAFPGFVDLKKDGDGYCCPASQLTPIDPIPAQHSDSKEQAAAAYVAATDSLSTKEINPLPSSVETFPGGFKVGDRICIEAPLDPRHGASGIVCHSSEVMKEWSSKEVDEIAERGEVPIKLDAPVHGKYYYGSLPAYLRRIKEEEPKAPVVKDRSGNGLDAKVEPAKPKDDGFECIQRDKATLALDNARQRVCLLCGALVPADDWRHELSIECACRRDRRHLPVLPKVRHLGDEE